MITKITLGALIGFSCYCAVLSQWLPPELPITPGPAVEVEMEWDETAVPADDCAMRADCVDL